MKIGDEKTMLEIIQEIARGKIKKRFRATLRVGIKVQIIYRWFKINSI
jgi:hypothetical protein